LASDPKLTEAFPQFDDVLSQAGLKMVDGKPTRVDTAE